MKTLVIIKLRIRTRLKARVSSSNIVAPTSFNIVAPTSPNIFGPTSLKILGPTLPESTRQCWSNIIQHFLVQYCTRLRSSKIALFVNVTSRNVVDPTLSSIGCSTSSNDIGPKQSNIVSPFIAQHWLYCSAGAVWTKSDRFYLTKADSTVLIILRGGEGLLDISDLCLAIIWRLNGLEAASNTKKDEPRKNYPFCFRDVYT